MFDYNFSGEEAGKRKKQGKGLGLYHARKLLELSNVTIRAIPGESVDEHYARNTFRLQFARK